MSKWDKLVVERSEAEGTGAVVYRFSGHLTNSPESYAFLDSVYAETRKGPLRAVINLAGVDHVSSAGVGILAACFTSITNSGGKLCLTGINSRVRVILNVVRLLDVMKSAETEEEAVRIAAG